MELDEVDGARRQRRLKLPNFRHIPAPLPPSPGPHTSGGSTLRAVSSFMSY